MERLEGKRTEWLWERTMSLKFQHPGAIKQLIACSVLLAVFLIAQSAAIAQDAGGTPDVTPRPTETPGSQGPGGPTETPEPIEPTETPGGEEPGGPAATPINHWPPKETPGPLPFVNKKQAVLMLNNLEGDVYEPGEFSVDVSVIRNTSPVASYLFEVHYSLDAPIELVGVEDVDLGGDAPGMDDEMTDENSRYSLVGALGNMDNELANLTLCRLNFETNASSSDAIKIWLEETEDQETLLGTEVENIPVFIDSRLTHPVRKRDRDRDRDGMDDDRETDDNKKLKDIALGYVNRWLKDSDGDGLLDGQEAFGADSENGSTPVLAMTHPRIADTDGDGFSDGMEVLVLMTDPLDPNDPPADDPAFEDLDGDGVPAGLDEDDQNPDQDGDGYEDGYEKQYGKNNKDPKSKPDLGDTNGDGQANNLDAVMLFNHALGNVGPLDAMENSDVMANGQIDNLDAIALFNWALGNQPTIPVNPSE